MPMMDKLEQTLEEDWKFAKEIKTDKKVGIY